MAEAFSPSSLALVASKAPTSDYRPATCAGMPSMSARLGPCLLGRPQPSQRLGMYTGQDQAESGSHVASLGRGCHLSPHARGGPAGAPPGAASLGAGLSGPSSAWRFRALEGRGLPGRQPVTACAAVSMPGGRLACGVDCWWFGGVMDYPACCLGMVGSQGWSGQVSKVVEAASCW